MKKNVIIASPERERIITWMAGLDGFARVSINTDKLGILLDDVSRIKPEALLLDFDLLRFNGLNNIVQLRKICAEARTIVLSDTISEDAEWNLLKAGIRGFCPKDIKPDLLNQVLIAVNNGELWIRRSLTCRLIDELGKTTSKNKAYRSHLGLLNTLTQREFDIAVRVGKGESNKEIAQTYAITERTVKAHLTEVYSKLGIADRLNLALIITTDDVQEWRNESSFQ